MMKSTKKKKNVSIKDSRDVNVAPCKVYRYRVEFSDKSTKDLMSPPYAFANDKDAMKWVTDLGERLLDDVKARYASITCYMLAECDEKGVVTFGADKLVGTVTRDDVLVAMSLKLEGYKNA